ncbi:recombinase family protein [Leucobacter sp.]
MSSRIRAVPDTPPRAVLYLRQSIARDDSISIELQEIAGRDYCAQYGYEVVAVEVDEGISGRTWAKRPAVQRVMDMIESRDADVIVLWKWSRLSRSRKDWALAADRVEVAGGRIESATEPIDTATASGRFARGVMTEYAAFQSEQIGEQWAEAHRRRFNLGFPPAGRVPWGWTSTNAGITITDENTAIIRHMYQFYFEGRGFVYIANWLNERGILAPRGGSWAGQTVRSCLDSPIHAGLVTYKGETTDGAHDPIISREEYERYRAMRAGRYVARPPQQAYHLLTSLVVCHCGRKRSGTNARSRWGDRETRYRSYRCPLTHPVMSLATWRVDGAVVAWLKELGASADINVDPTPTVDVEHLAREIVAIEKRLDALTVHLASGLVPEASYVRSRDMLLAESTQKAEALEAARARAVLTPAAYLTGNVELIRRWDSLQLEAKQAVARSLIETVTLRADGLIEVLPRWQGEPVVLEPSDAASSMND